MSKWSRIRDPEKKLSPKHVARAKADAREAVKLSKTVYRDKLGQGLVTVTLSPPPFPVWADDAGPDDPPLAPSACPKYYMISWVGSPSTPYPIEVDDSVLMKGEQRGVGRMQLWCMRDKSDAERIIKAAFDVDVKLPDEPGGTS